MAIIYTLDINSLKLLHFTSTNLDDLDHPKMKVSHCASLSKFQLDELAKDYPFSDTYHTKGHEIYSDIHRHDDKEARLIVKGECMFYIPVEQELIVILAFAGDLIKIEPNIDHWFATEGELMAVRFFSDEHGHVALKPSVNRAAVKAHHHFEKGFNISF
jgi:cupin superfamily acireductone dioxygenase involved in methionine salvage